MGMQVHITAQAARSGFLQGSYRFQARNTLHGSPLHGMYGYFVETPYRARLK